LEKDFRNFYWEDFVGSEKFLKKFTGPKREHAREILAMEIFCGTKKSGKILPEERW
jgi:hypothetical protein